MGTFIVDVFYIWSLTLTVSKGMVTISAIDPENDAVAADLIRNANCDSSFLRIACININYF